MDVDRYLRRIKYNGSKKPTLDVLHFLCWQHVRHVPFDTLGLKSGQRRIMDEKRIYENIVNQNRGGFCFELNGLFCWLLRQLGFKTVILKAQAYQDKQFSGDYSHLTIQVTLEDKSRWLVDSAVLAGPIRLDTTEIQVVRNGLYRILYREEFGRSYHYLEKYKRTTLANVDELILEEDECKFNIDAFKDIAMKQATATGQWEHKIRFETKGSELRDFQVRESFQVEMMDFHQTSQESEFAHNSFCILHKENGYICLWGRTFVQKAYIDYDNEVVCAAQLDDDAAIQTVLKEQFNVNVKSRLDLHERDIGKLLHGAGGGQQKRRVRTS